MDISKGENVEPDALYDWTKDDAPRDLFVSTAEQPVLDAYANVMTWVHRNPQFLPEGKGKFANGADGWLVAYAQVHRKVLVTDEVLDPRVKRRVPIPNVCKQFCVDYLNTFEMLRQLGVRFDLQPKK